MDFINNLKRSLKSKESILLLITIVIAFAFYFNNNNFFRLSSLQGIMQAMSLVGILAIGMSFLFIGGGIDLSMTFVALFCGVMCATMISAGVPWGIAVVLTLIIGACLGAVNAFFVTKVGIMAFIVTIALSQILQGVNLIITNAQDIAIGGDSFAWGGRTLWIFPIPFVIMTLLIIIYGVVLTRTQFGRNVYLVGGNENAARLAGVNPKKIRTILYINAGFLSSLAGIVFTSRMRSATPATAADWQMNAITASILGGIAFGGGSGSMLGCFIGVAMLNVFNWGLNSIALAAHWNSMASGALLLIALSVDFINERAKMRALMKPRDLDGGISQLRKERE
jgi:ribose transport system permease protein